MDFDGDWVSQKAAQMSLTESALNRVFYCLDVKRKDCLYILPKKNPDASDFSAARFGPAVELSPHLSMLFSDVNNVGHKRAGANNLYIRGAQSPSGLKSIPAPIIVFDELDEMPKFAIALAKERGSGKRIEDRQHMMLSTPTIPEFGINAEFKHSSQDHYFFECPRCGRQTEFLFPDCLIVTADSITDPKLRESHVICLDCKRPLEHNAKPDFLGKGKWVQTKSEFNVRGFYINQLYSCMVQPWEIAEAVIKGRSDVFVEKEVYRSKAGLPYIPEGARVTLEMIEKCIGGHSMQSPHQDGWITMGVDVGKWIHYCVDQWFLPPASGQDINMRSNCRNLKHGKVASFEELDVLMRQWRVKMCVIDANPERRKAYEFAQRFPGFVFLCYYNRGLTGKQINIDNKVGTVSVDRTSWLDLSMSRFHTKSISLPMDTHNEYKQHMTAMVKETKMDDNGNPSAKYISVAEDHFAHARNYAEIALPLAVTQTSGHQNIKDVL